MANPAREAEILLARVDAAIEQLHKQTRGPDLRELEELQRWRRELMLQIADNRRSTSWG